MIALIQRVTRAEVRVGGEVVGAIDRGVLALIGVRRADTDSAAQRLLERVLSYRIFPDPEGRMGLALREVGGEARRLFAYLVDRAHSAYAPVSAGVFGADMQVALVNDGPVTFWLETP